MEDNKEMINSLNGMIKSTDLADTKLAIEIIQNQPELADEAYKNKVWYNIKEYITNNTIKYAELYCHTDNHDKVYIIVVNKIMGKDKGVETIAYYGRRGQKTLRKDHKGFSSNYWKYGDHDYLKNEKVAKGYTVINEVEL